MSSANGYEQWVAVCICGHVASAHKPETIGPTFYPDQCNKCPCERLSRVLMTTEPKKFREITYGPDGKHALGSAVLETGPGTLFWVMDANFCHTGKHYVPLNEMTPIAYDSEYKESVVPTALNVLICADCREKVRAGRE